MLSPCKEVLTTPRLCTPAGHPPSRHACRLTLSDCCGTDDVTLDDAVEQPDEEEEGGAQNSQEEKAVKRKRTVEDEVCLPQSRLHAHRNAPPKVKVLGAGGGLAGWCHRRFRR